MMCIHFIFLKLKFSSCAKLTIHLIATEIMAYICRSQSKLPLLEVTEAKVCLATMKYFCFLTVAMVRLSLRRNIIESLLFKLLKVVLNLRNFFFLFRAVTYSSINLTFYWDTDVEFPLWDQVQSGKFVITSFSPVCNRSVWLATLKKVKREEISKS